MPQRPLADALLACLLLLITAPAAGQIPALSEQSDISMVTILPGDAIHAEFGHSALRVRDPALGIDRLYNYGTFDFRDPWFVPKFTYGRLTYFLSVSPSPAAFRHYRRQERPIIEQHLRLSRAQRDALFRFLEINARPENRSYQYDFLFDNCSTRVRDALEEALGSDVQFTDAPDPDATFRHLLDPYVADRPALSVGFDLALGTPTDRRVSPREAMFLPIPLMHAFDAATIQQDSVRQSLVTRTDTLLWLDGYDATEQAFPWPRWLGWLLFAGGLGLTAWELARKQSPSALFDRLLFGIAGIAGLLMTFLWFIAEHTVTNQNWNLLWAWPTHLIPALVLQRMTGARNGRVYFGAAALVSLITAIGWALWPQDFHPAVLPIVLLLALRLGWRAYRSAPANP